MKTETITEIDEWAKLGKIRKRIEEE